MQYGVCCSPAIAGKLAQAGFDFFEGTVAEILSPRDDAAAFATSLAQVRHAPLPCSAVNCFIPGDLRITGPGVDLAALEKYATTTFDRAVKAGVGVVVFGSGGARRIPDGYSAEKAHDQLVEFCRMLAPAARARSVTVAVEPLNRAECNVLTSVEECAALVREVNHPAVRLLVDAYHHLKDKGSLPAITVHGALLAHVHIATVPNRLPPGAEFCDFVPFFAALIAGGYDGRISIEANLAAPETDLRKALAHMHAVEKTARGS
jgi:sugar phosphate isomerase/epimerase